MALSSIRSRSVARTVEDGGAVQRAAGPTGEGPTFPREAVPMAVRFVDRRVGLGIALVAAVVTAGAVGAAGVTPPAPAGAPTDFTNTSLGNPQFKGATTEPSLKVARDGTVYVGAIRGLPSGIDLWRVEHGAATHLGSPDSLLPTANACCLALGGGDMDLALLANGTLAFSSLYLGSVNVGRSTDRGQTMTTQPVGGIIPVDDRQWQASDGNTVYMSFHDVPTGNINVEKSTDGLVYVPATPVMSPTDPALQDNQLGNLVADPHHPGLLYQVYVTATTPNPADGTPIGTPGRLNMVRMGVSTDGGSSWTQHTVFTADPKVNYASIFPSAAVDRAGNVFVAVSDNANVLVFSSTDRGAHWTAPVKVNSPAGAAVFPWISAGGPGGVAVSWFGASTADPNAKGNVWQVYAAESRNATAPAPTYNLFQVSNHVVHKGVLCESGLNCADGRQLGDFFQVAVGPDGIANLAWADDGAGGSATVSYARGGFNLGSPY
jgi:hypothetical protein